VAHHPRWKAGVPRDVGAGWDFEDVRDHYLRLLYRVDPAALRAIEHDRYLELSRQVTGEVMSEVLGEWRRAGSPCSGALILWLKDLRPGAGWGLLDHRGGPKAAFHHVRRAMEPVAVWSTDEGLGGVVAHIANDGRQTVEATLRISMYRDLETRVEEAERDVVLAPHSACSHNVEALLGRFVDASWAYRFGPPAQDLIVLSLEQRSGEDRRLLSQAFRFPAGRPTTRLSADQLGLVANLQLDRVTVSSNRFAYGIRLHIPGVEPEDDHFSIEPRGNREIRLRPTAGSGPASGHLTALNLAGRVPLEAGRG
jgi:beta-mannosidase